MEENKMNEVRKRFLKNLMIGYLSVVGEVISAINLYYVKFLSPVWWLSLAAFVGFIWVSVVTSKKLIKYI